MIVVLLAEAINGDSAVLNDSFTAKPSEILTGLKRLRRETQDAKKQRGTLNRDQRRGRGLATITALVALPSEERKARTAAETFTVTLCFNREHLAQRLYSAR